MTSKTRLTIERCENGLVLLTTDADGANAMHVAKDDSEALKLAKKEIEQLVSVYDLKPGEQTKHATKKPAAQDSDEDL